MSNAGESQNRPGVNTGADYDWTGNNDWQGEVAYSGIISPSSLGSSQNDWTPTGLDGSNTIRVTASTPINITGITDGDDGRVIYLENIGSNDITLTHQDAGSSAANRFFCPNNASVVLSQNESAQIKYDPTSTGWRVYSGAATSTGEANTASNVGTGQGLFKQKTGVDLEFHELLDAGNSNLVIALVSDDVTLDLGDDITVAASVTTVDLTATGDTVLEGTTLQDKFLINGDITPAQFTGDQVDYNPAGLATTTVLRLSSDATRTLSGIANGVDGRFLMIFNVGSFDINLSHDDAASTAANRFLLDNNGTDEINQNSGRILWYDSTSSRWRVIGKVGAGAGGGNVDAGATLTTGKLVVGQGNTDVATTGVTVVGSDISSLDTVVFATGVSPSHLEGQLFYDDSCGALAFHNFETEITLQIGQENYLFVRNTSGSTVTNGQTVYVSGAVSSLPSIALAQADDVSTAAVIGMATHDIENNTNGFVTTGGIVNDLNTNAFLAGAIVWLDPTTPGAITDSKPTHPDIPVAVGIVLVSSPTVGKVYINPRLGVLELQGVYDQSSSGDIILDSTIGGVSIQDDTVPIGANLFGVHSNAEAADFFVVDATNVTIGTNQVVWTISNGDMDTAGNILMENNKALQMKDFGGTSRSVMNVTAADKFRVGHTALDLELYGTSFLFEKLENYTPNAITGAATATINTYHTLADSGGGDYTVTLPTAVGVEGQRVSLVAKSGLTEVVTIDGNGTETIGGLGALTYAMVANHTLLLESDNVNWRIVGRNGLVRVFGDSNAGQVVTANTERLQYEDSVTDLFGAWTGSPLDLFTAPRTGFYSVSATCATTTASRNKIKIYKNGSQFITGPEATNSTNDISMIAATVFLDQGDTISLRYGASETRSTSSVSNWVTILEIA